MSTDPTKADAREVLRSLKGGPVVGLRNLLDLVCRHHLVAASLPETEVRVLGAVRVLIEAGLVQSSQAGGTLILSLSAQSPRKRVLRRGAMRSGAELARLYKWSVLGALRSSPETDVRSLLERARVPEQACAPLVQVRMQAAIQHVIAAGYVRATQNGDVLSLTERGRRKIRLPSPGPVGSGSKGLVIGAIGAAAIMGGCASVVAPAREPVLSRHAPLATSAAIGAGVEQARNSFGQTAFLVFDPCAEPTPKTRRSVIERDLESVSFTASPVVVVPPIAPQKPPAVASVPPPVTVFFASNSARLSADAKRSLAAIGMAGDGTVITVRGAADSTGSRLANEALAKARAAAVAAALSANGIEQGKLKVSACSDCYAAANETPDGRSANRRVDITFERVGS